MKNSKLAILFTIAFAVSLMTAMSAAAQGTLRYQNRYSKRDVSTIISTLENSSDTFRRDFDRAMDNSNLNGTNAEDRFNNNVRDYENSLDSLRRQFDRTDSWWTTRNDVSSVMQQSQTVNTMMNSLPFRRNLERQWNNMRNDLNKLADTYDLPGLNGGGWNGAGGGWNGGNNNDGNMSRPPNWSVGTFYSQDGSNITLTIADSGYVTALVDGQPYNGTYNRGEIMLNGDQSTVSKWGQGIRTYNRNTRQYTNYSRNSGGGGDSGGNMSRPPTWSVGTFYSQDGSNITLTIADSGAVTALVNGQSYYGTYNRGNILLNGDLSSVSQWGNGIRTYNKALNKYTNYGRNSGNGGGDWNGGGNMSRPPSWARGTFYSTNGDSNISLTIEDSGRVTAVVDGQTYYGTYYNGSLNLNGDSSTLSKNGNGIRTYNQNTRQYTNYRR